MFRRLGNSLQRDRDLGASQIIRKGLRFVRSITTGPVNLIKCDRVGKRPRTRCRPYIENAGKIYIGDDVNINSKNVQTDLITGPEGVITIANEVSINFGVSIVAYKKVELGNRIRVGPYTMILDTDGHIQGQRFKRPEGQPVIIEDDVWLATRVMVLKGSLIGRGSVIASGSVVSGVIPPYVVAGGMPARVLKYLKPPADSEFSWNCPGHDAPDCPDEILDRVESVFFSVFPHADRFDKSISPSGLSGWNSIRHVTFIRTLEHEFGIEIDKKDWHSLSNIDRICRTVVRYLTAKEVQQTIIE